MDGLSSGRPAAVEKRRAPMRSIGGRQEQTVWLTFAKTKVSRAKRESSALISIYSEPQMNLKSRLTEDMKSAMKSGDRDRLGVIRLVNAAIKQKEV
ncbi:MAG TPA: GatB/YqeY domain-containing protein, partial [Xanthomonadaceae bacterium]|nr:GatB/YqeY domain-containing protein [Xanthomonadaceae bacterium]